MYMQFVEQHFDAHTQLIWDDFAKFHSLLLIWDEWSLIELAPKHIIGNPRHSFTEYLDVPGQDCCWDFGSGLEFQRCFRDSVQNGLQNLSVKGWGVPSTCSPLPPVCRINFWSKNVYRLGVTSSPVSGRNYNQHLYRTQVSLESDLWVRMSDVRPTPFADLTDVTLADEDTNSILTDNW